MILNKKQKVFVGLSLALLLMACEPKPVQMELESEQTQSPASSSNVKVLPYLNIQQRPAKLALPFCETKACIDLDIQTLETVDSTLNAWIESQQAQVVQDQIDLKQAMTLQQAVDAYIRASDMAQEKQSHPPFSLVMSTRIPYQRNQYVLLQIGVNTVQKGIEITDRHYFFVANRHDGKTVQLLSIIQPEQQTQLDQWIQGFYQKWLQEQTQAVRQKAPQRLYWGQADWFFDQEGLGLHYRKDEIVPSGQQLDIYLTKQQTQQVVKAAIYEQMF